MANRPLRMSSRRAKNEIVDELRGERDERERRVVVERATGAATTGRRAEREMVDVRKLANWLREMIYIKRRKTIIRLYRRYATYGSSN